MGGLRQLMPRTYLRVPHRLARAGRASSRSRASSRRTRSLPPRWTAGAYGYVLWVAGLAGTFLTGLYTFRLLFLVFWGEPSAFVREHFHALKRDVVGISMAVPVAILAVLSIVGGWIQWAPFWDPITTWLRASRRADWSARELAGVGVVRTRAAVRHRRDVRRLALLRRRAGTPCPRFAFAQRVLEHKFYFDELYDAIFYRPAVWLAKRLRRWIEEPLIAETTDGPGRRDTRDLGGIVARAADRPPPHLRARDRARASPFWPSSSWSCGDPQMTTLLIVLPLAAALLIWLLPLNDVSAGVARAPRRARGGRRLDPDARRATTSARAASSSRSSGPGSATWRLVPRRRLRLLRLADRADGHRDGCGDRVRDSGRVASACAPTWA